MSHEIIFYLEFFKTRVTFKDNKNKEGNVNKILEAGWHFVEGFLGDNNMENDSYGDESFGAEFSVDHVLNSDQEKK